MDCDCYRCTQEAVATNPRNDGFAGQDERLMRMFVCAICGNKRCPHAADHRLECTGSNEPGQPGSLYEHAPAGADGRIKETPMTDTAPVEATPADEHPLERWPGYDEQSWSERFAVLDRRFNELTNAYMRHRTASEQSRVGEGGDADLRDDLREFWDNLPDQNEEAAALFGRIEAALRAPQPTPAEGLAEQCSGELAAKIEEMLDSIEERLGSDDIRMAACALGDLIRNNRATILAALRSTAPAPSKVDANDGRKELFGAIERLQAKCGNPECDVCVVLGIAREEIAALSRPSDKTAELLREALTDAAVKFEFYADEHQIKADCETGRGAGREARRAARQEKADRDRRMGEKMRKALAALLDGDAHLGEQA